MVIEYLDIVSTFLDGHRLFGWVFNLLFQWFQSYEMNSPRCSGHGTLKCGVCECYEGFQGEDCNCTTDAEKIDGCRPDPNAPLCSAHGTCKCNKCICDTYSESQVRFVEFHADFVYRRFLALNSSTFCFFWEVCRNARTKKGKISPPIIGRNF